MDFESAEWRREMIPPRRAVLSQVWGDGRGGLWAAGGSNELFRREGDGSWHPVPLPRVKGSIATAVIGTPSGRMYVSAYPKHLFTSDDGVEFTRVKAPVRSKKFHQLASGRLVAVQEYDFMLFSDDGGATFFQSNTSGRGVVDLGDNTLALPSGNFIALSRDGGTTWTFPRYAGNGPLFGASGILFCETSDGLLRSTDFGENWTEVHSHNRHLTCFFESPDGTFFLGGDNGFLATSKDRGLTWTTANTGVDRCLRAIWSDGRGVCAVGDDGIVLVAGDLQTHLVSEPTLAKKPDTKTLPQPDQAEATFRTIPDLVPITRTQPRGKPAHTHEITALALEGDRLASGDVMGHVALWRKKGGHWTLEQERRYSASSEGLAFLGDDLWVGADEQVSNFGSDVNFAVGKVVGLLARAGHLYAWCPPHLIVIEPNIGIQARIFTGLSAKHFDVNLDGSRWLVDDSDFRIWGEGTTVHVGHTVPTSSSPRWMGNRLVQWYKNEFVWVEPGKSRGKRALPAREVTLPAPVVDQGTGRIAWIAKDCLKVGDLARSEVVFWHGRVAGESFGGARGPHSHTRGENDADFGDVRALALDSAVVVTGNVDGELCAIDTTTYAIERVGRPSTCAQPASSVWTYRGRIRASTLYNEEAWAIAEEWVVIISDLDTGALRTTPVRIEPSPESKTLKLMVTEELVIALFDDCRIIAYERRDGTERFRCTIPWIEFGQFGSALWGFEIHKMHSAKRAAHTPYRLDLTSGKLDALVPPTPPGATDNAGWFQTSLMTSRGLIGLYKADDDDKPSPVARDLQAPGGLPASAASPMAQLWTNWIWNPIDGTVSPCPRLEDSGRGFPIRIGDDPFIRSRDGRYATWSSEGWFTRDLDSEGCPIVASCHGPKVLSPDFVDVEARVWCGTDRFGRSRLQSFDGDVLAEFSLLGSRTFVKRIPSRGSTHITSIDQMGIVWTRVR